MFSIAGCFVECNGKILLLKRAEGKANGGMWAFPAGKIENGEQPHEAAIRELREETGISVEKTDIEFAGSYIFNHGQIDEYMMIMHRVKLQSTPNILINCHDHSEFLWIIPTSIFVLPRLISDTEELLKLCGYS